MKLSFCKEHRRARRETDEQPAYEASRQPVLEFQLAFVHESASAFRLPTPSHANRYTTAHCAFAPRRSIAHSQSHVCSWIPALCTWRTQRHCSQQPSRYTAAGDVRLRQQTRHHQLSLRHKERQIELVQQQQHQSLRRLIEALHAHVRYHSAIGNQQSGQGDVRSIGFSSPIARRIRAACQSFPFLP